MVPENTYTCILWFAWCPIQEKDSSDNITNGLAEGSTWCGPQKGIKTYPYELFCL